MARILVVDDEPRYRDLVGHVLTADGHETVTASSGREALDIGARFRPDVLVTDWMLKDDIHGLHVVNALRAALPDMRSILMTGFSTVDLREGADRAGVCAYLEKPFDIETVRTAVSEALMSRAAAASSLSLAMMEIDATGTIVYLNAAARDMLAEIPSGQQTANLPALFADSAMKALDVAMDRWIAVSVLGLPKCWHVRSQEPHKDGSRIVVLRRADEPLYLGLAQIEMLLGVRELEHTRWPFDERVLVVDDESLIRTLGISMLEGVGAGCYAVETTDDAIRLLEKDEKIRFVLLDYGLPNADARTTVLQIRASRPDVIIVGISGSGRRDDFAAIGVEYYLEKPWRIDDLINLLTGRLGNCVTCGIPMPLRRPVAGETGCRWECCNCGARYLAMLDEDGPGDILSNVRPVSTR